MESPVVVHLVKTGTLQAGTSLVVIIIRAVEVTAAEHILHKVEVHHMPPVLEDLAVAMVLDRLTTPKVVVSTVDLVALEEVRTLWVVLETNNMDGSKENSKSLIWCGLGLMS